MRHSHLILFSFVFFVSACQHLTNSNVNEANKQSFPETKVYLTPIKQPTKPVTLTPNQFNSATQSPTTSTESKITATSIVPALQEILTPYTNDSRAKQLIQNPSCALPCWWNILPGITKWEDVKSLFAILNITSVSKPLQVGLYTKHQFIMGSTNSVFNTRIDAFEQNGDVEYMIIAPFLETTDFRNIWSDYEPRKILETYGTPSRILVSPSWYGDPSYILALFYDHLGFLVQYFGRANSSNNQSMKVCPDFRNGSILGSTFYIQSTTIKSQIEDFQGNKRDMSDFQNLQDASNLGVPEFINLFLGSNPSHCLTITK